MACAAMTAFAAQGRADVLVHHYDLTTSLNDTLGGPSLVSDGGTLTPGVGYTFLPGQGLTLSGGFGPGGSFSGNYRIEMVFHFDTFSGNGYDKVIDPKNKTIDEGLYVHQATATTGTDDYYSRISHPFDNQGGNVVTLGVDARYDLVRDGASGMLTGYFNGVQQFGFLDFGGEGIFDQTNNIVHFFEDDLQTFGGNENGAGTATLINIYQLTTVPEPSSLMLVGVAGVGLVGCGWRRVRNWMC
jgi:hypothetical protein